MSFQIANYLCPGNIVISGEASALEDIEKMCKDGGGNIRARRLVVAGAFHSEWMRPAADKLAQALDTTTIVQPRFPIYSNVDGAPHTDPEEIRRLLKEQLTAPVLFQQLAETMMDNGIEKMFEVGPGSVLFGLLRHINKMRKELDKSTAEGVKFAIERYGLIWVQ